MQLVSIGMPVFNGESFICEAIDSILIQSYSNIELIISDNASTDGTQSICRKYMQTDNRIRYVRQNTNIGVVRNFQSVLDIANGDYFMWAAHDDIWSNDWVLNLINNFDDGTAISFGKVFNIDSCGTIFKSYDLFNFKGPRIVRLCKFYLQEDTRGKANCIYGIFKRSKLIEVDLCRFNFNSYGEDMRFIFTYLQFGAIVSNNSSFLLKRVKDNVPSSIELKDVANLFIFNRVFTYLKYLSGLHSTPDKFVIFLIFPVKYIISLIYNIFNKSVIIARRLINVFHK